MATEETFGPATLVEQTSDGVGWFFIRDYGSRQEGLQEGTGSFLAFQSRNDSGQWGEWALVNGGLVSRKTGAEQGDLDLVVFVDGKPGGFAIVGNMSAFGGPSAGLVPIRDKEMNIGAAGSRIHTVYATQLAVETVGKQILVNGIWQWANCIPVLTQQGTMWLPVYGAHEE